MDNDFKKYYEGGMSLMDQADFQCGIADGRPGMDESMLEAFMNECGKPEAEAGDMEAMVAKASFSKVAATLGLNVAGSDGHDKMRDRRYRILRWTSGIAAAMALVLTCSLAWMAFNVNQETEWVEMNVPYGETSELILADGTKLHLNSGSRVTYPTSFNGEERQIFVEGEVLAEVAKNPEQPFVVHTEDMDVRVLGTSFNLKSYMNSDCVEVFLIEGRVRCDVNAENCRNSITLNPGNVVQYERQSGEMNVTNAVTTNFKALKKSGSMHFFNLTLSDIAKDLERHFNTEIIIMDEALARTRYFALFTNGETLDEILAILNSDNEMDISRKSGKLYIR